MSAHDKRIDALETERDAHINNLNKSRAELNSRKGQIKMLIDGPWMLIQKGAAATGSVPTFWRRAPNETDLKAAMPSNQHNEIKKLMATGASGKWLLGKINFNEQNDVKEIIDSI